MAIQGKTNPVTGMASIDVTPKHGMDLRSLAKNSGAPYIQNVIARNGEFLARSGFGLVREYDTTLNCGRSFGVAPNQQFGIGKCIGGTILKTAWGTSQILEVRTLLAFTGNLRSFVFDINAVPPDIRDAADRRAVTLAGLVAVVHDLHSGRSVEFVLHYQDTDQADLTKVFPNYATRFGGTTNPTGADHARWAIPPSNPAWAIFAPCSTGISGAQSLTTIVCIENMGLWTYRPIDTSATVDRANDAFNRPVLGVYMGEQSAFSPLGLAGGLLSVADGFVYLNDNDFGTPDCIAPFHNDRLIYAVGNTLWFSDPFSPQAVQADSRYVLPTSDLVTCIANWHNLVFIATNGGQSWVYQPTLTSATSGANTVGTVAQGSLTLISSTNGCVNPRAFCIGNDGVYFVDDNGIYLYAGGVGLTWLSKAIDPLWTDPRSLQLPLTDFYQRSGVTALDAVQLPARLDMRLQMKGARLTWDDVRKTLLCVCDDVTLCWTADFGWSCWLFQTHAGDNINVAGAANIKFPTILADDVALYLLGGPDSEVYTARELDNRSLPPATVIETVADSAGYLLKYGRGGSIDRSTCMIASARSVWFCSLSGYIVPGNVARIATNANHDWTWLAGDIAANAKLWAAAVGDGDTNYEYIAQPNGILLVAKFGGTVPPAVTASFLSGTGIFVATQLQVGAVADVSEAYLEDQRTPIGGYVQLLQETASDRPAAFYMGKPVVAPVGFTAPSNTAETQRTYWYPILLGNCTDTGVSAPPEVFGLEFDIDATRWEIIEILGGSHRLATVFPNDRLQSTGDGVAPPVGYGTTAGMDANHQLKYTPPAAPGNSGTITIRWRGKDGAGANGPWSTAPYMNLGPVGPQVLFYIGFRYIGVVGLNTATTFWPLAHILNPSAFVGVADDPDPAHAKPASFYAWQTGVYPTENNRLANLQQPIDWVVKSPELEVGGLQFRVRGVYITAMHLGAGQSKVLPGWIYGPLNTATSTDMRDYCGQSVDYAAVVPGNSLQQNINPYPRLQAVANAAIVLKTFRPLADTTGPKWGSASNFGSGNLLIGDAAVDTLGTSDGSQGTRASVMVHGTLNSPGDSVRVGKIEMAVVQVGQRRRLV